MESGNIGGAYGAGAATGTFNISAYFKKPQVICRCIGVLFSIVVFGCISSQGWWNGRCQYNNDPNACGFGVTIGVISFLGLLCFLIADGLFDNISSVQTRKYVVLADIAFSALWTFMWFVCFCYLTDAWRKAVKPTDNYGKSGVQAAIVFSFFSIVVYAIITSLAIMRYRAGISETFMARSEFDADYVSPNSRTPASSSSGYAGIGGSNVEAEPFGAPRPSTATYK